MPSRERGVMVSRRDLLKGGGAAATSLAVASVLPAQAGAALPTVDPLAAAKASTRARRSGPLYWSTYGYEFT